MVWTSTPVYVGQNGVVDQIDLNHNFYWDYVKYADVWNLFPDQTPWECATPQAVDYPPFFTPQMPPVSDPDGNAGTNN